MTDKDKETVARAICRSRAFDTGNGTCAMICMEQFGDARGGPHGCAHAPRIYNNLVEDAIAAIRPLILANDPLVKRMVALIEQIAGYHRLGPIGKEETDEARSIVEALANKEPSQ